MTSVSGDLVLVGACVLARTGGLLGTMPVFGDGRVPRMILAGVTSAIALAWICANPEAKAGATSASSISGAIAADALMGCAAGISARLILAAFPIAGQVIGGTGGLNVAALVDSHGTGGSDVVGGLVSALSALVFVGVGGPGAAVASLWHSFEVAPPGAGIFGWQHLAGWSGLFSTTLRTAVALALPASLAQLSGHLLLAVASKAAPQSNFFHAVGFVVPLLLGLAAIGLACPWLAILASDTTGEAIRAISGVLGA